MLFSERMGLKPIKVNIQINSMDIDLRNGLWNVVLIYYISQIAESPTYSYNHQLDNFIHSMWMDYFKQPLDKLSPWGENIINFLRDYFYKVSWHEVYSFIEYIICTYPNEYQNEHAKDAFNIILEREISAYRFIGNKIGKITEKTEIEEIEQALLSPYSSVNEHLKVALNFITDRKNPDYRNSIKESISAVESICIIVCDDKHATLGKALDKIEKQGKLELHTCFKSAFDKLYGYTSDTKTGIRHALLDENTTSFEDAKFMMITCSAFINYIIGNLAKIK